MRTLNVGAGNHILPDAVNHDRIKHRAEIDVAHDLNLLPWPWEDASFDKIVAISVFEHLEIDLVQTLNECWRLLDVGGILYIKLPHWQHDNAYVDPTHRWRYSLHSLKVFDPDTQFGRRYGFYTPHKWRIVEPPKLNNARSSFAATLEVRK